MEQVLKVGSIYKSSTGGTVKVTSTGLVHTASSGAYSGQLAEKNLDAKVFDAPKRGRGRPKGSKNR